MRNYAGAVTIMGGVAGTTFVAAMVITGCSGDDSNTKDSGPDVSIDTGTPDNFVPDTGKPDVNDGGGGDVDAADPVSVYRSALATALCVRYQSCCNGIDAGPFDYNKCMGTAALSAWNGSNVEITPEVLARGNVMLDNSAANACLAALSTVSCPIMASNEFTALTDSCYKATSGKLGVGGACIASIECQTGEYCKFAGIDGGKTDGGSPVGQCAALISPGGACGQAPPYGDPILASNECAYKGWHSPAYYCNYDSYPDAGGFTCTTLRNNGTPCLLDNECASGMCGALTDDCFSVACTCITSRNYTPLCTALKIKDAGPG